MSRIFVRICDIYKLYWQAEFTILFNQTVTRPPLPGVPMSCQSKNKKTPLGLNERDNGSYQSFYQKRYDISVYMGFSYPKITLPITFKTRRKDNYRPAGVPKSTVHCLKTLCFFLAKKKNSTNKTGLSEFNLKLFFAYCSSQD